MNGTYEKAFDQQNNLNSVILCCVLGMTHMHENQIDYEIVSFLAM